MKKMSHLPFIFILFLLIACGQSADEKKSTPEDTAAATDQDKVLALLRKYAEEFKSDETKRWDAVSKKLDDSHDFFKDFKFDSTRAIPPQVAQYYISEYKAWNPDERRRVGSEERLIRRTESVWIDKKAIAAFLLTLVEDDSIDGIRIYNAQYPINASTYDATLEAKVNGRKSMIFVATKLKKDHYVTVGKRTDGLYIYNYNSLCPDDCEGNELGGH